MSKSPKTAQMQIRVSANEKTAIAAPPPPGLSPFLGNYIAAMVEYACARRAVAVPEWTRSIAPLAEPVYGSELLSLRLYLLTLAAAVPPPQHLHRCDFG